MFQTLACDQTRLITFIWNGETSQQTFPWLGVNDPHHDMSHRPDGDAATRAKLIKVNRWYVEQVAYLAAKLDSVMEPNGKTMLDNSLVIFTDGLGKGNNHSRKNIPWVLLGSAGGALQTGQVPRLRQQAAQPPAGEHPARDGAAERDVLRSPEPEGLERAAAGAGRFLSRWRRQWTARPSPGSLAAMAGISFDFSGQPVLITGGASGIGAASARAFAAAGARVTVLDSGRAAGAGRRPRGGRRQRPDRARAGVCADRAAGRGGGQRRHRRGVESDRDQSRRLGSHPWA